MTEHDELFEHINAVCKGHTGNVVLAACTDILLAMLENECDGNRVMALAYLQLMFNEFAKDHQINGLHVQLQVHELRENAQSKIPVNPNSFSQFR